MPLGALRRPQRGERGPPTIGRGAGERYCRLRDLDRLFQLEPLARGIGGPRITAVEDAGELIGILGSDRAHEAGALGRRGSARRADHVPPLGSMTGQHQLHLGLVRADQRRTRGTYGITLAGPRFSETAICGLPVFGGSLARPFQGTGQRSRSQSLLRSRSSQ